MIYIKKIVILPGLKEEMWFMYFVKSYYSQEINSKETFHKCISSNSYFFVYNRFNN